MDIRRPYLPVWTPQLEESLNFEIFSLTPPDSQLVSRPAELARKKRYFENLMTECKHISVMMHIFLRLTTEINIFIAIRNLIQ